MEIRATRKAAIRDALTHAAVELIERRGYDEVTMADIAARAGVSRRTAFRYVATKDDLVAAYPLSWLPVWHDAIERHAQLPLPARLRAASHEIAAHIDADAEWTRRAFAVTASHPALVARSAAVSQRWIATIEAEILGRSTEPTADEAVRARMLAAAFMGMIDAVCATWARAGTPMASLIDLGLDLLDTALEGIRPVDGGSG
jgi:AcrR family transcriptional regulator